MGSWCVLGIETSCDDTAAGVVRLTDGAIEIAGEASASQIARHAAFGGVVPEIAARAHLETIDLVMQAAVDQAGGWSRIDAIAATSGPGLLAGIMVGLAAAKGAALARGLPLIAVNHLEGHALSPLLSGNSALPYLLLLVSGGHCQLLRVRGLGQYTRLGTTIDDAAGECLDKGARLIGLPQPGGPAIEQAARTGDPSRFALPRPLLNRPGMDFSFAGLKTAFARAVEQAADPLGADQADLAAGLQQAVFDILVDRSAKAMQAQREWMLAGESSQEGASRPGFVIAGGVAANQVLRARLAQLCGQMGFDFDAPPIAYATDNGVMIALAGAMRLAAGQPPDGLSAGARARWPLDSAAALAAPSHVPGRKGAKA